jgi:RHS repeat-associated protein
MIHQEAHNQPANIAALRRGVHRYGFNGKEVDSEGMGGGSTTYDYGFRIYNAQLGKFLSVDPLTASYPWYTPYQFAGNKPIMAVDVDGLEDAIVINSIQVGDDGVITGGTSCTAIFSKTQNNRGGVLTVNIFSDGRTTYELIPNLSIVDEHTALNRVKNIFSDVTDVVKDFFDPEAGFYYESIDGGSLQTGRMGHGVAIKDMELVLSAISLAGNAIKAGGVKAINGESLEQMNDFIERVDDIYNVVDAWIKTNEIILDEYIVGENYERQGCDYSIPTQPELGDSVKIYYDKFEIHEQLDGRGGSIQRYSRSEGYMKKGIIPKDTTNQMVDNDPFTIVTSVEKIENK